MSAVYINHMQRFRMFNNQVGPAVEVHSLAETNLYLFGDIVLIKNRSAAGIELYDVFFFRGNASDVVPYILEHLLRIHHDAVERRIQHVAQQGRSLAHLAHHFLGSIFTFQCQGKLLPFFGQVRHVFMQFLYRLAFCQRAHNNTEIFRLDTFNKPVQSFPLFSRIDFFGKADRIHKRNQHNVSAGQ